MNRRLGPIQSALERAIESELRRLLRERAKKGDTNAQYRLWNWFREVVKHV